MLAPEIGALVEFGRNSFDTGPGEFRVSGWLRPVTPRVPATEMEAFAMELLAEVVAEKGGMREDRLEWCLREEATHVALSGICGAVAPVSEVKVTGMVGWPEEVLRSERESAERRGRTHEVLF